MSNSSISYTVLLATFSIAVFGITKTEYAVDTFLSSRAALIAVKCYYGSNASNDTCLRMVINDSYPAAMVQATWEEYDDDALFATANKWSRERYAMLAWKVGFAHLIRGQLYQAVRIWKPAISVMPIEDMLLQNGNIAEQKAELSRAEALYLAYVLLHPSADRYELLGDFYLRAGRSVEAAHAFEQGAVLGTKALRSYLQGRAAESKGDFQLATQQYRQAISDDVKGIKAYVRLAKILAFKLGEWHAAIMICQSAVSIAPHDYACYEVLGLAYAWLGDNPSAIAWLEMGIRQVDDRYATAYQSLFHQRIGFLLLKDDRLSEAESHFMEAIKLSPSNAEAYQGLASIYDRKGNLQAAIIAIQKAIDTQLNRGYIVPYTWYVQLAEMLERMGDVQQSLKVYQEALLLAPNDSYIIEREQALRNASK